MHARAILSFNRENEKMLDLLNIGGAVCLFLREENGEAKYVLALE
jgi:hypothetical protein